MKPFFRLLRWVWKKRSRDVPGAGTESDEQAALLSEIEQTREEWLRALHWLDNAVEPEMIDHAIYTIQAAQRKYEYLMRLARDRQTAGRPEDGRARRAPGSRSRCTKSP